MQTMPTTERKNVLVKMTGSANADISWHTILGMSNDLM